MPKPANQRIRLMMLLNLLREETDEQHPLSVPTIVKRLADKGVTIERKSVYDYLDALQSLGYDILFRHRYGYYLGEREFQLAELELLVDAVQASKFITPQKTTDLIEKLSRHASRYQAVSLQRQVYSAGKSKSINERIYYAIDAIYQAIAQDVQITFLYFDYDRKRQKAYRRNGQPYTVSPFALVRDSDNYYLIAYDPDAQQLRHYRADKMEQINALEDIPREGHALFEAESPAKYVNRHFGMFRGEEEAVLLRCQDWIAHILIDRFGDDVHFYSDTGDTFRASVRVMVSPQFFGWLFGLSGGAEIIEPAHVREQYRDYLSKELEKYR